MRATTAPPREDLTELQGRYLTAIRAGCDTSGKLARRFDVEPGRAVEVLWRLLGKRYVVRNRKKGKGLTWHYQDCLDPLEEIRGPSREELQEFWRVAMRARTPPEAEVEVFWQDGALLAGVKFGAYGLASAVPPVADASVADIIAGFLRIGFSNCIDDEAPQAMVEWCRAKEAR